MASINKVLLMGNLTRDPELRYMPQSQTPVVAFGVAVNRRWKNQAGEWQEETTFVDCEGFSKTAEFINKWFKKGQTIFIEGRLKLDQWQDKDGGKRSKLKIIIEAAQFAEGKPREEGEQQPTTARAAPAARTTRPSPVPPPEPGDHDSIPQEKIPF